MKQLLKRLLAAGLAVMLLVALAACGGKEGDDKDGDVINAVEYGVDNTGKTDMTDKIVQMHKDGAKQNKKIYYPNGTYIFNGLTLDFTSGVEFESMDGVTIRNSKVDTNIINFDDKGNLIGLMHNHLEHVHGRDDFKISGNLVSPPLADISYETTVDAVPYWYNDFGRETTLAYAAGWLGWYDWRWNHHDAGSLLCQDCLILNETGAQKCAQCGKELHDPYAPELHPLLGWYRGDDPVVLDWICYWMMEYGMKQSILINSGWRGDEAKDPAHGAYWVYQLLNNTPNAKQMKFALQPAALFYDSNETELRSSWWNLFDTFYFNEDYKDMVYCYEEDGKRYAVLNLWDEQSVRMSLAGNNDALLQMYKDAAEDFRGRGYDGIFVTARFAVFAGSGQAAVRAELREAGVLYYESAYPHNTLHNGSTYPEKVQSFYEFNTDYKLYGVATAIHTHDPHPSQWVCPGHSPEQFQLLMSKTVSALTNQTAIPKIVTIYNVSEWAEGGPGLIPTVGERFGYLEAVRDTVVKK